MKKITTLAALLLTLLSAQAEILIDQDFKEIKGDSITQGFQNKLWATGEGQNVDEGWIRGATARPVVEDGTFLLTNSHMRSGGTNSFQTGFGQVNSGNAAVTGPIQFAFTVDSVNLDGDETIAFDVDVYAWNGGDATYNCSITLQGDNVGTLWTYLGSVKTDSITAAGVFTTGAVDMGLGHDIVGVRIEVSDSETSEWGDGLVLSNISVVK